ncbi:MAG: metallophosphoesterase family protein [Ignavibacteria bacterium]|nr:metallophosphoesterase family protein [Ignavibacteria bacterium]
MILGFLSDIHEDVNSLQKAFNLFEQEKVDSIICLGDIVGFALPFYKNISDRDANKCVELIKANCSHVVAGNHDLYALRKIPSFTAGFNYGENWYSLNYEKRAKLARNKIWLYEDTEIPSVLNDEAKDFLDGLGEFAVVQLNKMNLFISHFCYPDLSGSAIFFPEQSFHLKMHFTFIENLDCKISVSGHGHPEGCVFSNEDKLSFLEFGEHEIRNDQCWMATPCVAKTSRKNGVLVFNTDSFTMKILELTSF